MLARFLGLHSLKLRPLSLMNIVNFRIKSFFSTSFPLLEASLDRTPYVLLECSKSLSIALDFASLATFRVNRVYLSYYQDTLKRDLLRGHKGRFHSSRWCPLSYIGTAEITFQYSANATLSSPREKTKMFLRERCSEKKIGNRENKRINV